MFDKMALLPAAYNVPLCVLCLLDVYTPKTSKEGSGVHVNPHITLDQTKPIRHIALHWNGQAVRPTHISCLYTPSL